MKKYYIIVLVCCSCLIPNPGFDPTTLGISTFDSVSSFSSITDETIGRPPVTTGMISTTALPDSSTTVILTTADIISSTTDGINSDSSISFSTSSTNSTTSELESSSSESDSSGEYFPEQCGNCIWEQQYEDCDSCMGPSTYIPYVLQDEQNERFKDLECNNNCKFSWENNQLDTIGIYCGFNGSEDFNGSGECDQFEADLLCYFLLGKHYYYMGFKDIKLKGEMKFTSDISNQNQIKIVFTKNAVIGSQMLNPHGGEFYNIYSTKENLSNVVYLTNGQPYVSGQVLSIKNCSVL